ncbi:acyl carrier protein, partial [Streptomyces sp. NPDC054841]
MRDVNEDVPAYAAQRATAESIERGGGGLGVTALLAKVMTADTNAQATVQADTNAQATVQADTNAQATVQADTNAQADADAGTTPALDVDGLAAAIAAAAGRYLPGGHLSADADFFDAGGSSIHAVELVAELEGELGMEIDLDDVFADARPISLARRWLPSAGASVVPAATGARGCPVEQPSKTHRTGPQTASSAPAPSATPPTDTAPTPVALPVPSPCTPTALTATPVAPHSTARREDLDQILADL